jgi:hypothetical protein
VDGGGARQVSGPPDVPPEVLGSGIPQLHVPGGVLTAGAVYVFALRAAVAADRSQVWARLTARARFDRTHV